MNIVRCAAVVCGLVAIPFTAGAMKLFVAPATWAHTVTANAGASRTQDVWRANDAPAADVISVMSDAALRYDDALGAVRANVRTGATKLTLDRDRTCERKKAHTFEMSFGSMDTKTVVNQTLVDDAPGTTRITYSRLDGEPFADDVKSSIAAYCEK